MLPLDGPTDYVNINLIVNPWQAIVVCVFIFALMIWPQLSARQTTRGVEKTLTTNYGGSTVKDANDRQERALAEVLTKLGDQTTKLDEHIEWAEGYVKDTGDRLTVLEAKKTRGLFRRS